jgi:hypothetical protein
MGLQIDAAIASRLSPCVMREYTMFERLFKKAKPHEWHSVITEEIVPSDKLTPARQWVNLLLIHMHQDSIDSIMLQKSKGIPTFPLDVEVSKTELTYTKIINRLKVMSGLDPKVYKTVKDGIVSIRIGDTNYDIKTTFDDANDQSCNIALVKTEA